MADSAMAHTPEEHGGKRKYYRDPSRRSVPSRAELPPTSASDIISTCVHLQSPAALFCFPLLLLLFPELGLLTSISVDEHFFSAHLGVRVPSREAACRPWFRRGLPFVSMAQHSWPPPYAIHGPNIFIGCRPSVGSAFPTFLYRMACAASSDSAVTCKALPVRRWR